MPRQTRNQSGPSNEDGGSENIQSQLAALEQRYEELLNIQNTQRQELENQNTQLKQRLDELTGTDPGNRSVQQPTRSAVPKAPTLQSFSGKASEKNSTSLQAFFFRVRKAAQFASMDPVSTLTLAVCHLDGRAATWYMRLESQEQAPETIDQLKTLMIKEFIPSIEKSQAKMALVSLRMNYTDDVDKHIDKFEELMEISGTDMAEGYSYFFLTLPDSFKVDLTKFFEGEAPGDIHSAYKRVRTLGLTRTWTSSGRKKSDPNPNKDDKNNDPKNPDPKNTGKVPRELDPKDDTWGRAKNKAEAKIYSKHDRCFKCGKVGWSEPDHPCKKKKKEEDTPKK